jgi:hypothetical protein
MWCDKAFPQHAISQNGDVQWPARSPNLAARVCFFRGKEKIKQKIREEISAIPEEIMWRLPEDFRARSKPCVRNGRKHLRYSLLKKNKIVCNADISF